MVPCGSESWGGAWPASAGDGVVAAATVLRWEEVERLATDLTGARAGGGGLLWPLVAKSFKGYCGDVSSSRGLM